MTFEDDLSRRLTERAANVDAEPDLGAVEAGSRRRRNRRRGAMAAGAVAVAVLGVGGVVLVSADSDPNRISSSADTTGSTDADDAEPVVVEPTIVTLPPADLDPSTTDAQSATDVPATDVPATDPPVDPDDPGPFAPRPDDPATEYLDRTVEIYRGTVGSDDVVVRRSTVGVAELFGLEWRAPTGTAECFGESALFVGYPGLSPAEQPVYNSAWFAFSEHTNPERPTVLEESWIFDEQKMVRTIVLVVTTRTPADEAVLRDGDGVELDRSPVTNGVTVLGMSPDVYSDPAQRLGPTLTLVSGGVEADPETVGSLYRHLSDQEIAECRPPQYPQVPLPEPGEQPADAIAAEAEIRSVHAQLVDRSTPLTDDGPALLDDDTGVTEAAEQMDAGNYADVAATVTYTIHDVVFTTPTEAWFDYTIDSENGAFDMFGIARFDGSVWQITRETICQDLALAAGVCDPPTSGQVQPPLPDDWDDQMREFNDLIGLYFSTECPEFARCS